MMLLSAGLLHPLQSIWLQLGLSTAFGALLMLALALWLRPWRTDNPEAP